MTRKKSRIITMIVLTLTFILLRRFYTSWRSSGWHLMVSFKPAYYCGRWMDILALMILKSALIAWFIVLCLVWDLVLRVCLGGEGIMSSSGSSGNSGDGTMKWFLNDDCLTGFFSFLSFSSSFFFLLFNSLRGPFFVFWNNVWCWYCHYFAMVLIVFWGPASTSTGHQAATAQKRTHVYSCSVRNVEGLRPGGPASNGTDVWYPFVDFDRK